jgi:hemolysin III
MASRELEEVGAATRPFLRGRVHEAAFWMSAAAGPALILAAPSGHRVQVAVYALTLALLLGTSALYHRVTWQPIARRWMRRADHAMIFLLIGGTYTAVAPLALDPLTARRLLVTVWVAAAAGVVFSIAWPGAPKPLAAAIVLAIGWVALAALPGLSRGLPGAAFGLLVGGGIAYTCGAIVYALKRPNPLPRVAGYHEIFHALVVIAAAAHFGTVALALGAARG